MKKISTGHIMLVLSVILQYVLLIILSWSGIQISYITTIVLTQLMIITPFLVYCIWKKENPLKLIRLQKISALSVILSIFVGIICYPIAILMNMISMLFVENAMTDVVADVMPFGIVAGVALLALLPAVVEETLFRGVIYNSYSKRRPLAGVFLSALLFGLMHMNFNQLPYAIILGIIMALMMEACDTILAPMIIHFSVNATSTVLNYLIQANTTTVEANNAASYRGQLRENFVAVLKENGMEYSSVQLDKAFMGYMICIIAICLLIIALICLVDLALVYFAFRVNKRRPSEVFKADHSDTAYIENKKGVMKKNRMIDIPVLLFIAYAVMMCILSI